MAWIFLILGIVIDVFSCYLYVKRIMKGVGPSGIPGISVFLYMFFVVAQFNYTFAQKLVTFICLFYLHYILQYAIPSICWKILK